MKITLWKCIDSYIIPFLLQFKQKFIYLQKNCAKGLFNNLQVYNLI